MTSGLEKERRIYVAKPMALIICAVIPQLTSAFDFAYANSRFSYDSAHYVCNDQSSFLIMKPILEYHKQLCVLEL